MILGKCATDDNYRNKCRDNLPYLNENNNDDDNFNRECVSLFHF